MDRIKQVFYITKSVFLEERQNKRGMMGFLFGIALSALQMVTGDLKEISAIFVMWTVHEAALSALFLFLETLRVKKMISAGIGILPII